jgi:hypothetical protein
LGIGATVTIYSVVDGVMLRPLAYDDPSSLVVIGAILPTADPIDRETGLQELAPMSLLNLEGFRERTRSFEKMGALESGRLLVSVAGDSQDFVGTARVTAEVLEILGGAPALGRMFLEEEYLASHDGASMITYGYWQRRSEHPGAAAGSCRVSCQVHRRRRPLPGLPSSRGVLPE